MIHAKYETKKAIHSWTNGYCRKHTCRNTLGGLMQCPLLFICCGFKTPCDCMLGSVLLHIIFHDMTSYFLCAAMMVYHPHPRSCPFSVSSVMSGEYTSNFLAQIFLDMDQECKGNLSRARYQKDKVTWANSETRVAPRCTVNRLKDPTTLQVFLN